VDALSGRRVAAAIRKEFRQFFRDPVLLILVLWLYTVEVVICATALSFDLKNEAVAVLDLDRSASSRALAESFDRSPTFRVRYYPATERDARRLLDRGEARLVMVLPVGYGAQLGRDGGVDVQLLVDGTNSLVALTALGQAQRLAAVATQDLLRERGTPRPRGPTIDNRVRVWYNPALHFTYPVVISMIATAAFMVGVLLPAAGIVKEKERGTLEQLLVSPLRPIELLLAKTVPTVVVGLLAIGPSLLVARLFDVPLRGDPLTLALLSTAFLVCAVAVGVVIASLVRTLQQALLVTFFVLFPIMFLSGTIMPVESMPPALEMLSRLSPLRHYMDALLGIFLKGAGFRLLWSQLLAILGLGGALFIVALALFRRRLA
jgi:ABC-2 type transport system permease protein